MPKGDVPGEWYSPTQPFPTKPPPTTTRASTADDLIDFTPELRAEALKMVVDGTSSGRSSRPPVVSKAEGPLATPSVRRAARTGRAASYDPETHIAVSCRRTRRSCRSG